MERKIEFSVDEYYHVYNRGVDKRIIFTNSADYHRFVTLLFVANSDKPVNFREISDKPWAEIERGETLTDIGAWCLMPNHFHLLLREKVEGGISRFLTKLLTGYSMYFNKRHNRTGRLFQNTFRASHADQDDYLKYLFAYIHLNPIKLIEPEWKEKGISDHRKINNYLSRHYFSSYPDYQNQSRQESLILNRSSFPKYFDSPRDFRDYLADYTEYQG